jgi:hypothetical protein
VPRRHERHRDARPDLHPIVPVVRLRRDRGIMPAHDGVVAERRDHAHPMRRRQPRQRRDIEMIVVAVRDQRDIDRRQVRKIDARIIDPLRPEQAER